MWDLDSGSKLHIGQHLLTFVLFKCPWARHASSCQPQSCYYVANQSQPVYLQAKHTHHPNIHGVQMCVCVNPWGTVTLTHRHTHTHTHAYTHLASNLPCSDHQCHFLWMTFGVNQCGISLDMCVCVITRVSVFMCVYGWVCLCEWLWCKSLQTFMSEGISGAVWPKC